MRQLFSRLLVVTLLVLACSGAVWGDNLKVTITKSNGTQNTKTGQESLEKALEEVTLSEVEGIEVSAGDLKETDWIWLKEKRTDLSGLKKVVVTEGIGSVADIPDTKSNSPYFKEVLNELRVAKLKRVGKFAFYGCSGLRSVSLPMVTEMGEYAFLDCKGLTSLELGATSPSVGRKAFLGCPLLRKLEFIDADGSPLTGDALANAISRYRAVDDGDTEDNLWYGWAFEDAPSGHLSGTIDGVAFSGATSLEAAMQGKDLSKVKEVTITGGRFQLSDWVFLLEQGQHGLAIEKFTVESSVDRVAAMPDLPYSSPRYLPKAQKVNIAKIQRIGAYAFRGCEELASLSLPMAIEIGYSAFMECTDLTSVSLPAATEIGDGAFYRCGGLTSVSLQLAQRIGEFAFSDCYSLTSLLLPSATEIEKRALQSCSALLRVSLPKAKRIGEGAFAFCEVLTSLQLGATPPRVWGNAFYDCPVVRKLELVDAGGSPLTGDALKDARSNYRKVEDGNIEDNLWYGWAFEDTPSSNLSGSIDGDPFTNAASLKVAMEGKDLSTVKDLKITGGSFQVSDWGFLLDNGQSGLAIETFTIESSVDRVADMPDLSFYSPQYLPKAKIVSIAKMQRVGDYAFKKCTSLTSVSLPAATEIGGEAFYGCEDLTSLQLDATPPRVDWDAFFGCPVVRKLELLDADGAPLTGDALKDARSNYRKVEDGDTEDNLWYGWAFEEAPAGNLSGTIDGVAFTNAASLEVAMQGKDFSKVKEVTITGGRFQLSDWGFLLDNGQSGLAIETFTIASSVDRVADMPELPSDGSRYLPKAQIVSIAKMQGVGDYAFKGCTSLTSVSLPVATWIGESAFEDCDGLTSVSLPMATIIGPSAFEDCRDLTHVSLSVVTDIKYSAFLNCVSLTGLALGATPPSVGNGAFRGCPVVRKLELLDADGTPLTGGQLDNAKFQYRAVKDGDTGDNLWYGWAFEEAPAGNLSGSIDGVKFTDVASLKVAMEGKDLSTVKDLKITGGSFQVSDWGFLLDNGQSGLAIETFTIESSVDKVADMPDLSFYSPQYLPKAKIVSIAKMQRVGDYAFKKCTSLTSVSLPAVTEIGGEAFYGCEDLTSLQLGATPPRVDWDAFSGCPAQRTLIITDSKGVALVGPALSTAANAYDGYAGDPIDGKWKGWAIQMDSPRMGSVEIVPVDCGTVSITRKDGGEVVSQGDVLKEGAVLVVEGKPENGYRVKAITAEGAKKIGDKEWEVTAMTGKVTFTVEFEKLATLGVTIKTPAGTGEVTITRKDGGAVVSQDDVLKEGAVLVVVGKPVDGYRVKAITAAGAKKIGEGNEWKVTAKTGEVIFTVEFEKLATLGATVITPAGSGTVSITRKASGDMVNKGDALTKDEVLIVKGEPDGTHKVKKITAAGATNTSGNEWKVTAKTGEVIFTVEFEKLATLGATVITPAGSGTVSITRKASGDMVNKGDALTKDEVLIVKGEPDGTHKVKKITAAGATNTSGNEWKVTAKTGEVIFTVEFEKKAEGEGNNNNNNNDHTPVESVLLAQVQLSPNPTGGQVTIDAGTTLACCAVYNSTGVLLQAIESPKRVFTIDLTASPSGVYLVRLVDMQGGCKTLRVVKQ